MIASTDNARVVGVGELAAACARAEHARIAASLELWEAELAQVDPGADPFRHTAQRTAAVVTVAAANGWSERVTACRLHEAQTARDALPNVWAGFAEGRLDSARVSVIAQASWKLTETRSVERLDKQAAAYARTHTVGELRSWVRRFVARVEPEETEKRFEQIVADRSVTVVHHDDGTGDLYATNFPSYVLADVEKRLDRAARRSRQAGVPGDERTLAQRAADAFTAALTRVDDADDGAPRMPTLTIGVTVPAATLAGLGKQPAVSADRDWIIPAGELRRLATSSDPFWYKLLVDEDQNLLSVEYKGRFAPDHLTQAIRFRDGCCRFPGCRTRGTRCEIDHRIPHPDGPTAASNQWLLCKKHHLAKTFDSLTPVADPDGDWIWRTRAGAFVA